MTGILWHRPTMRPLAERLAQQFSVVIYDRRGRGESGDRTPYAVEREVEDLGALITEVGGTAAVYGHSSGAGLALLAAASGLPITRLVLHEPPYGPDDEQSRRSARELAENIEAVVAERRWADAIETFFTAAGMPPEMLTRLSRDPNVQAAARTMPYDFAVMGNISRGGTIPEDQVPAITSPTLVLSADSSPAFFGDTAERITELLPNGTHVVLDGQTHDAPPDVVAPVVTDFLTPRQPMTTSGPSLKMAWWCRDRHRRQLLST